MYDSTYFSPWFLDTFIFSSVPRDYSITVIMFPPSQMTLSILGLTRDETSQIYEYDTSGALVASLFSRSLRYIPELNVSHLKS